MIKEQNIKVEQDMIEVADLLVAIVKVAKEKGNFAELLPKLIVAIEGMNSVPESWQENRALVVGSFLFKISEILDVLVVNAPKA